MPNTSSAVFRASEANKKKMVTGTLKLLSGLGLKQDQEVTKSVWLLSKYLDNSKAQAIFFCISVTKLG